MVNELIEMYSTQNQSVASTLRNIVLDIVDWKHNFLVRAHR